ncbi:LytR/AlgR family response regulator transcription factor [Marinoscillum furvescens]|uniref:LytTR family two component transcriptional regulator n=1 Tax=Marinoscillum furvescens DSM 4134 TaxID=1122208 RepID=A0A3D9LI89_MARFU|nr:LytTR family DNA-binding domain-containing protein [Marinoscillum furvescens]REE05575.1 LytTR family two component transcriptional regulator [Marinoscillum furvescens DSM 4134]
MLSVVIIEDEPLAAEDLEKTLSSVDTEAQVVAKLDSVESATNWLENNEVDLILSDIELGDGLSFDIFRQVNSKTPIIITTAYDQYAIRAFKENSVDYLLKPIDKSELAAAIAKYKDWKQSEQEFDMSNLLDVLRPNAGQKYQERFLVTLGEKIHSIPEPDVAYFFSEDRYTFLVTKQGTQHIINTNLGDLETNLNPKKFYRINRKFIISYASIQNMVSYSKSRVKIDLVPPPPKAMEVIVSVERSGPFKRWLND